MPLANVFRSTEGIIVKALFQKQYGLFGTRETLIRLSFQS